MVHQSPISKPETTATTGDVVGVDVPPLVRLAAEFEAWAKATKSKYEAIHGPPPRPYIYNPRAWYGALQRWGTSWGEWLWPEAVKWWSARGYELKGKSGQWFVEPNA